MTDTEKIRLIKAATETVKEYVESSPGMEIDRGNLLSFCGTILKVVEG